MGSMRITSNQCRSVWSRLQQYWWPRPITSRFRIRRRNDKDLGSQRTATTCFTINRIQTRCRWKPKTLCHLRVQLPLISTTERRELDSFHVHACSYYRSRWPSLAYLHQSTLTFGRKLCC